MVRIQKLKLHSQLKKTKIKFHLYNSIKYISHNFFNGQKLVLLHI